MRYVLLLSGGLDSAVLLYRMSDEIGLALTVDYGQDAYRNELLAADDLARRCGVEHEILNMRPLESLASRDGDVFPNRNMVLISAAMSISIARGMLGVVIGSNLGDRKHFKDCRSQFMESMDDAAHELGQVLLSPLKYRDRAAILAEAQRLKVPIDRTWSCYGVGPEPCGECLSCQQGVSP